MCKTLLSRGICTRRVLFKRPNTWWISLIQEQTRRESKATSAKLFSTTRKNPTHPCQSHKSALFYLRSYLYPQQQKGNDTRIVKSACKMQTSTAVDGSKNAPQPCFLGWSSPCCLGGDGVPIVDLL